jgi:hypothetical protein
LTFIDGTADFSALPCENCPAMTYPDRNYCDRSCKANFLTWLFNEGNQNGK